MPKLSAAAAAKVEEAEGGDFEAIPEGTYRAILKDEVESCDGKKGPYWKWTFEIVEDGVGHGRRMWLNTSLSDAAAWKLNEVFKAFGVPTTTDTDDLIGKEVKLVVIQEPIEQGKRAGDMGNSIDSVLPVNQATVDADKTGGKKKSDDKDDIKLF